MTSERRRLNYRGFDLRLENDATEDEARAVVDKVLDTSGDRLAFVLRREGHPPRSDGKPARVFVKAEFRRPDQAISRRLRRGRAVREGRGLRLFAQAGVAVPPLLLFGEQSRLNPRGCSLVCTQKLKGLDAGRRYARTPDPELPLGAARALARVHAANFVHGDAVLRNFLPSGGTMYVIDMPRWHHWTADGAERDLAKLLGSSQKRGMPEGEVAGVLAAYEQTLESNTLDEGWQDRATLAGATFLEHLLEKDLTRDERRARRAKATLRPGPRRA